MACYAAIVSLAQTIQHILVQHVDDDDDQTSSSSSSLLLSKQQIKSFHERLIFLRAFLEDFPMQKLPNNLQGRTRGIAYEAEDIVDKFVWEHSLAYHNDDSDYNYSSSPLRKYVNFKLHDNDFKELYEKLQKVTSGIDSVSGEVQLLINDIHSTTVNITTSTSTPILQLPPTGKDVMVGFEDNLMAIYSRLCGESSKLQVIPIFGMGGIGKTALARKAYDNPLTVEHFDIRAWVTVSEDYGTVEEIISGLKQSLKDYLEISTPNCEDSLAVYQILKGRRYLIVLDDMWTTNVWDEVRRSFPDDSNGSRIMITTRLSDVAEYSTDYSSPPYEMSFIDADQSWDLLRLKVFKHESDYCTPELENIGKMIANSCRGLPLAIIVIAGVLSTISRDLASWRDVSNNVTSTFASNYDQIDNILSVSYAHLPQRLRPCFLYMGCFPEDHEIHAPKLVKLWVAEGFVKPNTTTVVSSTISLEEEQAEIYLEDLVKRSLVLVTSRNYNSKIKTCSLHDLVRDLCIKKSKEDKFLLNVERVVEEGIKYERRLSINRYVHDSMTKLNGATIRSILCFRPRHGMLRSLEHFRFLRILDAVKVIFGKFPAEVTELMFFLRYLAFSISSYQVNFDVPSSIYKLQNLQTLFIFPTASASGIRNVICLPLEIWKMTQLRHVFLFTVDLPGPVPNSSALENLQTLRKVRNFQCTRRILRKIPNLRKLGIVYDGEDTIFTWRDYHLENLVHLHLLEKLNIRITDHYQVPFWRYCVFPTILKKLKLRSCTLRSEYLKIVGSLSNLQVLKLRNCSFEHRKWETTEGEFPRLKCLQIIRTNLKHWITESSHFPRLKHLKLYRCEKLRKIPGGIGETSTLELIEVYRQDNESLVESVKQTKEEQQSYGNDSFEVRITDEYISYW